VGTEFRGSPRPGCRRSARSWWTSTRSHGRRCRRQDAAIGLQLAGVGIERGPDQIAEVNDIEGM